MIVVLKYLVADILWFFGFGPERIDYESFRMKEHDPNFNA